MLVRIHKCIRWDRSGYVSICSFNWDTNSCGNFTEGEGERTRGEAVHYGNEKVIRLFLPMSLPPPGIHYLHYITRIDRSQSAISPSYPTCLLTREARLTAPDNAPRSSVQYFPVLRFPHLCGGVDQTEDVVEDEVAARAVGEQLEALAVVHGLLFLVDLHNRLIPWLFDSRLLQGRFFAKGDMGWGIPGEHRSPRPEYHPRHSRAARQRSRPGAALFGRGETTARAQSAFIPIRSFFLFSYLVKGKRTDSFSMIAAVPWTEDVSKVSIEWSRYMDRQKSHVNHPYSPCTVALCYAPWRRDIGGVSMDIRRDQRGFGGCCQTSGSRT